MELLWILSLSVEPIILCLVRLTTVLDNSCSSVLLLIFIFICMSSIFLCLFYVCSLLLLHSILLFFNIWGVATQQLLWSKLHKTRHSMIGSPERLKIQRSSIPKIRKTHRALCLEAIGQKLSKQSILAKKMALNWPNFAISE